MALDSPLLHDGSQFVSNANFFNPASALAGPNGSAQFLGMTVSASRVLSVQTTIGGNVYGVLQNSPVSGDVCDVGILGITKAVAGAAIAAGAELMVDASGRFITWVAGSGYFKCGMALETVGAVNTIFTSMIYMPNYKVVT